MGILAFYSHSLPIPYKEPPANQCGSRRWQHARYVQAPVEYRHGGERELTLSRPTMLDTYTRRYQLKAGIFNRDLFSEADREQQLLQDAILTPPLAVEESTEGVLSGAEGSLASI